MIALPNEFTTYQLTEDEQLSAAIFTFVQKARLQTSLAEVAQNILNLTYDPAKPLEFVQQESFLKGQLNFIRFLLLASDESEQQHVFRAQQSSNS